MHGIRHRSAPDIASSGIPVKADLALTAHQTATMFLRYVHTEDGPAQDHHWHAAGQRPRMYPGHLRLVAGRLGGWAAALAR